MNSSGWIRGMMAKNYENEKFLLHVGEGIEKQLQEWDANYSVNIMKLRDYHFVVRIGEKYYETVLSEKDIRELQSKGPYSLDYKIWSDLEEEGLEIKWGYGDYLDKVFWGRRVNKE